MLFAIFPLPSVVMRSSLRWCILRATALPVAWEHSFHLFNNFFGGNVACIRRVPSDLSGIILRTFAPLEVGWKNSRYVWQLRAVMQAWVIFVSFLSRSGKSTAGCNPSFADVPSYVFYHQRSADHELCNVICALGNDFACNTSNRIMENTGANSVLVCFEDQGFYF